MRRVLALVLLLTVETACPHAWGRGGTLEKALARDMKAYYSLRDCSLDEEDWLDLCMDFHERKNNPQAQRLCPPECRPVAPR
ncbi:hypothetical protein F0U61_49920 [Archangium violaceum]|uniref:hypothetical protein n=1 Tax=Archangium violaceum TaxID=83451 RepID=UPI002B2B68A9|nr:hypothetical protein F0U61_49920 [Archangium violaceum]